MKKLSIVLVIFLLAGLMCACTEAEKTQFVPTDPFEFQTQPQKKVVTEEDIYKEAQIASEVWFRGIFDDEIDIKITNIKKTGNIYKAYGVIYVYDDWGSLKDVRRFVVGEITIKESEFGEYPKAELTSIKFEQ